ncbi:hypothetical protein M413DRAFT_21073 [Hebeloma cylindrosporum]|uniref:Uncharacterized protein n=1 Tax=Hebeloma cylindrosporum TaxID=76867 RepID=A0A0C3CY43_HEBCY|nr:hypothetical protein M413DRAFT_21073 [Hebeloma cylindrosporum h7]
MGRVTGPIGPPNPSAKVIFFADRKPKRARSLAEREIQDDRLRRAPRNVKRKQMSQDSAVLQYGMASTAELPSARPGATSVAPQTNTLPLSKSLGTGLHNFPPNPIMHRLAPGSMRAPTLGPVQGIIKISEEVDANNGNLAELIGKMTTLSQVTSEELKLFIILKNYLTSKTIYWNSRGSPILGMQALESEQHFYTASYGPDIRRLFNRHRQQMHPSTSGYSPEIARWLLRLLGSDSQPVISVRLCEREGRSIALQEPVAEAEQLSMLGRISIDRANDEQAEANLLETPNLHRSHAIPDPTIKSEGRAEWLETAFATFSKIDSVLEQAGCLHFHGLHRISRSELELAMEKLANALPFHIEVDNIHGQVDDLSKIAEVLRLEGRRFHGQGNDFYIQYFTFPAKDHLEHADVTIRKAIKLHETLQTKYALVMLRLRTFPYWAPSSGANHASRMGKGLKHRTILHGSQKLWNFEDLEAVMEYYECEERRNVMQSVSMSQRRSNGNGCSPQSLSLCN